MEVSAIPVPAVKAVISLCGAMVLALIDIGLRRKGLKDPTLIWLYLSLLSWSASGFLQAGTQSGLLTFPPGADQVPYLFSPVSTVLFTVAAFRLSRVREVFRHDDLRLWPRTIVASVAIASVIGLVLMSLGYTRLANNVDAGASLLALTVLACGLVYSFYKYGTQLLAGLSAITFILFIIHQFNTAAFGPPSGLLAGLSIAYNALIVLLFIALAVAWGLSESSRSKILGHPQQVTIICMIFDLRGSTQWARDVIGGDYHYAGTFVDQLRSWAWQSALQANKEKPNLVKFLGDGFLFVWETPQVTKEVERRAEAVVNLACTLTSGYEAWAKANGLLWKEVPDAIGAGVDVGSAIRLTFENGSEDYLGEPINIAAKMQHMARPSGGVVIRETLWARITPESSSCCRFQHQGTLHLGRRSTLAIRCTVPTDPLESIAEELSGELPVGGN